MPMRRAIGISLACLVTSACVTSETLEGSKSNDPVGTPTSIAEESTEALADDPLSPPCAAAEERWSTSRRSKRAAQRLAALGCGSIPDPDRTVGRRQFGRLSGMITLAVRLRAARSSTPSLPPPCIARSRWSLSQR